ncbi:LCP family protein [Candidatus Saccharibacteria bacterium]|nr:LCP family protein [Candidatus Saccharibacteria bacterium]
MSSGRSIDGLAPAPKKRASKNTVDFNGSKKPRKKSTTVRARQIGIEDAHSDFWDDEVTGLGLTRKSHEYVELGSEESLTGDDDDLDSRPSKKEKRLEKKRLKQSKKAERKAKKRKDKKKHRVRRFFAWFFGILLVLVIAAGALLYFVGNDLIAKITDGGNLWSFITSDPDVPLAEDPNLHRTNILIFGTEGYSMDDPNYDGGQLTDSIMIASLNQEHGDIKMVSLPRDLKVKTCTATGKLNELYYCTYVKNNGSAESRAEYEIKGAEALEKEVEKILGLEVQYFIHVNWQALVQLVDAIGGIDVAFVAEGETWSGPEVAIQTTDQRGLADYEPYCRCYSINYENGKVYHLNGEKALAVARARNHSGGYGASGGNFSREQFQQKIIQAIIMKAKSTNLTSDLVAVLKIKDAIGDNLRTNFKDTELRTALNLTSKLDASTMKSLSLESNDTGASLLISGMLSVPGVNNLECGGAVPGCLSYVYPRAGVGNYTKIHDYIKSQLSSNPTTEENAQLIVMNNARISGLAAREAERLEEKGLTVIDKVNAPAALGQTEDVTIYQRGDFPRTAESLHKIYPSAEFKEDLPSALSEYDANFIIVFGNGYQPVD